jgi:hypothetical protein
MVISFNFYRWLRLHCHLKNVLRHSLAFAVRRC